jgi:hypothetical protein
MTDQAPSAATLAAVRKLNTYDPPSESAARKVALRLWPKADPDNLDTIISAWRDQRRPLAKPQDGPIKITVVPIGSGHVRQSLSE